MKSTLVKRCVLLRELGILGAVWGLVCCAALADDSSLVQQGQRAFEEGAFSQAASLWEKALTEFKSKGDIGNELSTSVSLAKAYQTVGQHRRAVSLLEAALQLSEKTGAGPVQTLIKDRLGAALTMTREFERAEALLRESLNEAKAAHDQKQAAASLNDQGNLFAAEQQTAAALAAYQESATLAAQTGDRWMRAQALCNAAAAAATSGEPAAAEAFNTAALGEIDALEDVHAKAFLLLKTVQTDRQIGMRDKESADRLLLRAHKTLTHVLQLNEHLQDPGTQTYALGYLAQLYEQDGQMDYAYQLTRQAAFAAQQARMPEALYRWEWQSARLLRNRGETGAALDAYRRAVATLDSIRNDIAAGAGNVNLNTSFRQTEGPLFFELADLLLQRAKASRDSKQQQEYLVQARDVVEQLKAVELQDYLCDDCAEALRAKTRKIESVDARTAVVYFICLSNRTETLVGLTSGLRQFTLKIGAEALTREVRDFRHNLETRTSYGFLEQAERLYSWLIRPIHELLQTNGIDTLVFVPDGALRTIPFASLYSGERFLIEDYAVAVAPGLTLVESRPITSKRARLLLAGISEPVQGFSALHFVSTEVKTIAPMFNSETLLNNTFTSEQFQRKLENERFSIVHIASHGEFNRDVRKTFVLTHDGKLNLNGLEAVIRPEQYRGQPVELLVLNACQTAAGDDRAALGLAGVAVKAGARSALATLWFVNDQSTSILIAEFYKQLEQHPGISKARALQAAQIKLLQDRRYWHPCYWSPYLIIGNWL